MKFLFPMSLFAIYKAKARCSLSALCVFGAAAAATAAPKPNVVVIYADDMGYGDMAAYAERFGTTPTAATPNMDALAGEGLMFTQAHSSNGVCTPSRYSLLTGKYNWREFDGITLNYGEPMIPDGDTTIAEFLEAQGYDTAAFGKWHLGGYFFHPDGTPYEGRNNKQISDPDAVDWEHPMVGHAVDHGFDTFKGLATTINFAPYVYVHDDRIQFYDTELGRFRDATNEDPIQMRYASDLNEGLGTGTSARNGLGDPSFSQVTAGPIMIGQVEDYLAQRADDPDPFFAYVSLYSPHKPWHVTDPFKGSEGAQYPDFIHEVDHRIGRVVDALDANGFYENTVVILTSDNGPEIDAFRNARSIGGDPNGSWRGLKREIWEGGTRVPFVVRWPGQVAEPGSVTDALIWQGDIFRTIGAYLGADMPPEVAPDGESFLNILRGDAKPPQSRDSVVLSSLEDHRAVKFTDGWKLLDSTGSGAGRNISWDSENNPLNNPTGTDRGTPKQLFDLDLDPGENNNRIAGIESQSAIRDELVALAGRDLLARLDQYRSRTTNELFPPFPDNDRDGMPNGFETASPLLDYEDPSDAAEDPDGDGLDNIAEYENGTDPGDSDSDGDRLRDGAETQTHGTDPADPDSDGDGLEDGAEVLVFLTDPRLTDSDGDGVNDGREVEAGANPAHAGHTPEGGVLTETVLPPSVTQLAGVNGSAYDPRVLGREGWPEAGDLFIRERRSGDRNPQWRTRLFLRFDLSRISGTIESARLRLHQRHKLNDQDGNIQTSDLMLGRVTEPWGASAGDYPVFDGTGVTEAFAFGNNQDFGSAEDASGFYGGTPGSPADDDAGLDPGGQITAFAEGWRNGGFANHGLRFWVKELAWVGVAFSENDDPGTPDNESPALLVTHEGAVETMDRDGNRLPDAWEMANFGGRGLIDGRDDADGDGFANYAELATGTDMTSEEDRPRVSWELSNGKRVFDFLRYRKAAYRLEPEVSDDLDEWTVWTNALELLSREAVDADYERLTFRALEPLPERLFVRLRIGGSD